MKGEPCPECGSWSETSDDGNSITHHYGRSRREWITKGDCETCQQAHWTRMREVGERMAKRQNELFLDAVMGLTTE